MWLPGFIPVISLNKDGHGRYSLCLISVYIESCYYEPYFSFGSYAYFEWNLF